MYFTWYLHVLRASCRPFNLRLRSFFRLLTINVTSGYSPLSLLLHIWKSSNPPLPPGDLAGRACPVLALSCSFRLKPRPPAPSFLKLPLLFGPCRYRRPFTYSKSPPLAPSPSARRFSLTLRLLAAHFDFPPFFFHPLCFFFTPQPHQTHTYGASFFFAF